MAARVRPGRNGASPPSVLADQVVWIFGSGRTGSTWLSLMLGNLPGNARWNEPLVGHLFGHLYQQRGRHRHGDGAFVLADEHRESWLPAIRDLVLTGAAARFPELSPTGRVIVQEPHGALGAPLLAEAMPESRLILLVRDPRDVAASALRVSFKKEAAPHRQRRRRLAEEDPTSLIEGRARGYPADLGSALEAYERHRGPKQLVRYEDLRADTRPELERVYSGLGLSAAAADLDRVVERHRFERAQRTAWRRATPGGWRDELTEDQARIVERHSGWVLDRFYPGENGRGTVPDRAEGIAADPSNGRRRGDSTLLVTFCNVRRPVPSVAAIDLAAPSPSIRWIELRDGEAPRGARGMCFWKDLVCVAHEPSASDRLPAGFVLLDPARDFERVAEASLPGTPHSVCSRGEELHFTMSGEDSVYRAVPNRGAGGWALTRRWTVPGSSGAKDTNHLNAIELVDGNVCVSATGPETGPDAAPGGFVYDTERSDYLMKELRHPHSLLEDAGELWACETPRQRIVSREGAVRVIPGDGTARVRGLAIGSAEMYVGVSKQPMGSVSQGTPTGYRGSCLLYRLRRDGGEPELMLDLSESRDEIYELMLL